MCLSHKPHNCGTDTQRTCLFKNQTSATPFTHELPSRWSKLKAYHAFMLSWKNQYPSWCAEQNCWSILPDAMPLCLNSDGQSQWWPCEHDHGVPASRPKCQVYSLNYAHCISCSSSAHANTTVPIEAWGVIWIATWPTTCLLNAYLFEGKR